MKQMILLALVAWSFSSHGQGKNVIVSKIATSKNAGFYSYGNDVERGRVGSIFIYPETDSTALFYIDLNRGAPSYNMGSLYGRVNIASDTGIFYTKFDYADRGCRLIFHFTKNSLSIKTADDEYVCGFGYHVIADGDFKRKTNKSPGSFVDAEGKKTYFRATSPEVYNKD